MEIDLKEYRFDTYSNITCGVRVTHIPSGSTVECCETRSISENIERAFEKLLSELRAKGREQAQDASE